MGISNLKAGLRDRVAVLRGELEETEAQIKQIEEGIEILHKLTSRATKLRGLIMGAEDNLFDIDPECLRPIKPRKKRRWHSPFKTGDIGRRALEILRIKDRWMRPREIADLMLEQISLSGADQLTRQKLTNSVGGYLRSHDGDLVESRGDYVKEWRVIRDREEEIDDLIREMEYKIFIKQR